MQRDVFTLYGLEKYECAVEKIVEDLKCEKYYFDLKLILTEAITNVFKYGNKNDNKKPIYLSYEYKKDIKYIKIKIRSKNNDLSDVEIIDKITDDMLEETNGRGLFLIKCITDAFYFSDDAMIIEKSLN